jgi:hypothetical protein
MKGLGILLTIVMLVVALNTQGLIRSVAELTAFVSLAFTAYQIRKGRNQNRRKDEHSVKSSSC